jgi:hypothetical protein
VGNCAHLKQEGELRNGKSRAREVASQEREIYGRQGAREGFHGLRRALKPPLATRFLACQWVVASEIDVFSAKRRDVLEQGGIELP